MRTILLLLFMVTVSGIAIAQSDADSRELRRLRREGIEFADRGEFDKAIERYQQGLKLDPDNALLKYEIAYVYYQRKNYKECSEVIEKIIDDKVAEDVFYQLLGNSYDMLGNAEKSVSTYEAGLKRFPNSGPLHLEAGNMAMVAEDYDKAVKYWEDGIEAAPQFPSNYYWAAKLFMASSKPLWGLFYGEIFINLERGSKRTEEISELLFKGYRKTITIGHDSSRVDFLDKLVIIAPEEGQELRIPFTMRFVKTMLVAMMPHTLDAAVQFSDSTRSTLDGPVSISTLNNIRSSFIRSWFGNDSLSNSKKDLSIDYPNVLFDWHKTMVGNGHFEAYNYWLLNRGDPTEFEIWYKANKEKFTEFADWFQKTPIPIDKTNYFSRIDAEK